MVYFLEIFFCEENQGNPSFPISFESLLFPDICEVVLANGGDLDEVILL